MTDKRLITYLFRHCLAGILAGWLLLAGLIVTDVGRIGSLLASSQHWVEAMVLLVVFFAITFGSLAMGSAVMLLHNREPKAGKPAARQAWRLPRFLEPQAVRLPPASRKRQPSSAP